MINIDPITLEPTIDLDAPAWYSPPIGVEPETVREWALAIATESAEDQGRPWAADEAAATLTELGLLEAGPDVSARIIFLPDLTGRGLAYDIAAFDPAGGPTDVRQAHRMLLGADEVGEGSLLDINALDDDGAIVGLQVFDVRDSLPQEVPGGARIIPIAFSRCVIRRSNTPLGTIDLLAAGVCEDIELAAFSLVPLHLLLLGDRLFE